MEGSLSKVVMSLQCALLDSSCFWNSEFFFAESVDFDIFFRFRKKITSETGTESANEERKEKKQGEIAMEEAMLAAGLNLQEKQTEILDQVFHKD